GSAASLVGAAGEGGPRGPVGAVVGDDHGGLGVAQRVVGGQRAVVRVDLPVATLADRAGGELVAAGLRHRDLGGGERLGVRAAPFFPERLERGAAERATQVGDGGGKGGAAAALGVLGRIRRGGGRAGRDRQLLAHV